MFYYHKSTSYFLVKTNLCLRLETNAHFCKYKKQIQKPKMKKAYFLAKKQKWKWAYYFYKINLINIISGDKKMRSPKNYLKILTKMTTTFLYTVQAPKRASTCIFPHRVLARSRSVYKHLLYTDQYIRVLAPTDLHLCVYRPLVQLSTLLGTSSIYIILINLKKSK